MSDDDDDVFVHGISYAVPACTKYAYKPAVAVKVILYLVLLALGTQTGQGKAGSRKGATGFEFSFLRRLRLYGF